MILLNILILDQILGAMLNVLVSFKSYKCHCLFKHSDQILVMYFMVFNDYVIIHLTFGLQCFGL
jgi:hypothetical protein